MPDTTFRESLLGHAAQELSHVENLSQRVPIVLAALLVAAAAVGLGDLLRRVLGAEASLTFAERLALDYGLGAGLLGVLTLFLGRMGWLSPSLVRTGLAVVAIGGLRTSRHWRARQRKHQWLVGGRRWLLFGPFVVLMVLGSMLPSIDFDVLEYHLQGPKEYYQAGRISFLPHNVYTNMPFDVEMLHLLAMEVMGDWWWGGLSGQLLVALFAPAAAVLIAGTARRGGSNRAGWIAALVYLSTPWIYRMAVIAYVEGPLCFYHAALVWVVVACEGAGGVQVLRRFWLLGLLAGCAMGCKYTGLVSAVIPFGLLAVVEACRRRSPALVGCYVLGWAIVMVPWLGKNVIDTGNPVYPLECRVFPSPEWDAVREARWQQVHGPRKIDVDELKRSIDDVRHRRKLQPNSFRAVRQFWSSLVDVAGRSDWQSPLYVALASLALFARARAGCRHGSGCMWRTSS